MPINQVTSTSCPYSILHVAWAQPYSTPEMNQAEDKDWNLPMGCSVDAGGFRQQEPSLHSPLSVVLLRCFAWHSACSHVNLYERNCTHGQYLKR